MLARRRSASITLDAAEGAVDTRQGDEAAQETPHETALQLRRIARREEPQRALEHVAVRERGHAVVSERDTERPQELWRCPRRRHACGGRRRAGASRSTA